MGYDVSEKVTWQEACRKKCAELANLLIRKQMQYGKRNIEDFGELGILVRANDKMSRLKNLYKTNQNPISETIDDSWIDLAGYSILAGMVRDKLFELPFEEEK